MTRVARSARSTSAERDVFMERSSGEVDAGDDDVDGLDADEGDDHPSDAVDEQVAAEQSRGADGPVLDSLQRQRDQGDDDQRVEDRGREDGALTAVQLHDVERAERGEGGG